MSAPENHTQRYQTLYHAFTTEYTRVNNMVHQFYPEVKKFVQVTGPEVDMAMTKLSGTATGNTPPAAFHAVTGYMSAFDDFTLHTNKSLGELSAILKKSEAFIHRALELKQGNDKDEQAGAYMTMVSELDELMSGLDKASLAVLQLEKQMHKLTGQWKKAKEGMY